MATAREAARHRTLCGNVRQAYHRFNGAAPNQEWRDQRGQARVWPTCQQNSSLFSRAPIQKFSSAARRQARRRRRKISGTSPTCRFLEEIRPSRAPACSPCGPAPAASRAACSAWLHRHRDHGTFNLRRSNAPSGQCCAALRARRGAQMVTAQRVLGGARKALLRDRSTDSHTLTCKQARLAYGAASCSRSSALRCV